MNDMTNTEAEKVAVDPGVQNEIVTDARFHRREARRLLAGKSGMTREQKIERMEQAADHLAQALGIMDADGPEFDDQPVEDTDATEEA